MSEPKLITSDQELIDLGAQMLTAWWRLAIQALFDTVGSDKTMEMLAPNIKGNAGAVYLYQRERFGRWGYRDCPDWIFASVSWTYYQLMWRRSFKDVEITAKGGKEGKITSCPFQGDMVDVCKILCDMMSAYTVSSIDPDLRYVPKSRLTTGDTYCSAELWYKGKSLHDDGETIATLRRLSVPKEEMDYVFFAWMGEWWAMACNSTMEFFGEEEALELLRPYMMQNGMATALQLKEKLRLKDNNAQTIGEIIDYCNLAVQQKGRVLIASPNHFEKEITECPFYGMSHTLCNGLLAARSNGICNAINPEYGFFPDQRMCKGDKICHWAIKKR